jgi:G:T-mismatch repair DNA endonuclease (very short patch repair protein)
MTKCKICDKDFEPKNQKKPPRTCSKECKNELARRNTIKQFSDPTAREVQRQKSLAQKKDPEYQKKVKKAMKARTRRWAEQGHPRLGMKQPESAKEKIGQANKGRFKGKTWEEIYGKDVAERRKKENSLSMSKKNEVLLKEKRSSLEERVLPYLKGYDNNVQISYYNVDFINKETNHIIEIHGDYWHCNPDIYPDDFVHPYFKMTAKERRKLDEQRKQYLESLGYSVTVVWESDLDEFIGTLK